MKNIVQGYGTLRPLALVDFVLEDLDGDSADTVDWGRVSTEDVVNGVCIVRGVSGEPSSIDRGVDVGVVGQYPVGTECSLF